MIQAYATDDEPLYFAEIEFPNSSEKTIFYLPKTHFTIGGYKSVGSRSYYLGLNVSGSVTYLSQMNGSSGADASVSLSDSVFSAEESFYNYCEF